MTSAQQWMYLEPILEREETIKVDSIDEARRIQHEHAGRGF